MAHDDKFVRALFTFITKCASAFDDDEHLLTLQRDLHNNVVQLTNPVLRRVIVGRLLDNFVYGIQPFRKELDDNDRTMVEKMYRRWRNELELQLSQGKVTSTEHTMQLQTSYVAVLFRLNAEMASTCHPDGEVKDKIDLDTDEHNRNALWRYWTIACRAAFEADAARRTYG